MARKMTKAESQFWGTLIMIGVVVGLPIFGIIKFGEAIGWHLFVILIVAGAIGYFLFQRQRAKNKQAAAEASRLELLRQVEARRASLTAKYSDEKLVDAIMRGSYWQGQTAEQLLDSLGAPVDVDEKVLKTKKREIWKYHQLTANRFGL
jgi:cbb3-type cytochrome oxidase subunit 3